jgi:hypothetical protein
MLFEELARRRNLVLRVRGSDRSEPNAGDPLDQRRNVCHDMARAVRFYEALGFSIAYGAKPPSSTGRARVIFYVDDVDAMYAHVLPGGFTPETPPRDAKWGERYFHLTDPDGHPLSFARPLRATDG